MSLITISCCNGPQTPVDPMVAITKSLAQPASIRSRLWSWLPGQPSGSGLGMRFDQNLTAGQIQQYEAACAAAGSDWSPYIGIVGLESMPAKNRNQILREYRKLGEVKPSWLGLDNSAANHSTEYQGIIETTARTWLKMGGSIALEANGDRPWIRALAAQYGQRVAIMANQWMWETADTSPAWLTIEDVALMGARSIVLVCFPAQHFDPGDWTTTEIGQAKMTAVRTWDARRADEICVRPSALTKADIDELVSMNA